MKSFAIFGFAVALLAGTDLLQAQETPQTPAPEKEHQWLQQLVGQWETRGEAVMGPGQPPVTCEGTQTVRAIGPFWTVSETTSNFMETPVTGIMTLGYDPEKEKFVGTWIDSMTNTMWTYEGTLDETGKILTLKTEGPNPTNPGETSQYKETIEVKSKDHKVFSSSIQGSDGKWFTFVTIDCKRKK